jgi:hypothetical protein
VGEAAFQDSTYCPLQKQLKMGVYIPTGAHIKYTLFAVKYRSDGPENISCVTPFEVITVI